MRLLQRYAFFTRTLLAGLFVIMPIKTERFREGASILLIHLFEIMHRYVQNRFLASSTVEDLMECNVLKYFVLSSE